MSVNGSSQCEHSKSALTAKMAEFYRKKAQQKRLAGDAMKLLNFDAAIAEATSVAADGTK